MAGLLRQLGGMLRETGQAIDKLGCVLSDNPAFREQFWRHKSLISLAGAAPKAGSSAFVAPSATVAGNVVLGDKASVWYGAVLRGDAGTITIGSNSNVQDNAVITTGPSELGQQGAGTTVGSNVTIGHNAMLQGATVEDGALVGIAAVLRQGSVVRSGSIVAAGSVLPPGAEVPPGQLWAGSPAVYLRDVKPQEAAYVKELPAHYAGLAAEHAQEAEKGVDGFIAALPTAAAPAVEAAPAAAGS